MMPITHCALRPCIAGYIPRHLFARESVCFVVAICCLKFVCLRAQLGGVLVRLRFDVHSPLVNHS